MKVSILSNEGADTVVRDVELIASQFDPIGGIDVVGCKRADFPVGNASVHVLTIDKGGSMSLHAGTSAYVFVVRGRGSVALPAGRSVPYQPETALFVDGGAQHGFQEVLEDTVLAVCHFDPKGAS